MDNLSAANEATLELINQMTRIEIFQSLKILKFSRLEIFNLDARKLSSPSSLPHTESIHSLCIDSNYHQTHLHGFSHSMQLKSYGCILHAVVDAEIHSNEIFPLSCVYE